MNHRIIPPMEQIQAMFSHNYRVYYTRFTDDEIDLIRHGFSKNHVSSPSLQNELIEALRIDHPLYLKMLSITRLHDFKGNRDMFRELSEKAGSLESMVIEPAAFQPYANIHQGWIMNEILGVLIHPKQKLYIGNTPKDQVEEIIGFVDYYIETPTDAYSTINHWWPDVLSHIHVVELIIPDVDAATPVVAKRLWETEHEIQCFDIRLFKGAHQDRQSRKWTGDEDIIDMDDKFCGPSSIIIPDRLESL